MTVPQQTLKFRFHRGNSSVGRARPCQGRGREFESRFPLQIQVDPGSPGFVFKQGSHWPGGRVVMQRPAKPRTPVRFRPRPPFFANNPLRRVFCCPRCVLPRHVFAGVVSNAVPLRHPMRAPGWRNGRRRGLKIPRCKSCGFESRPGHILHSRSGEDRTDVDCVLRRVRRCGDSKVIAARLIPTPGTIDVRSCGHRLARTARMLSGVPCRATPLSS